MVQRMIEGPTALGFLQRLTPASLTTLAPFSSTLSVLLNREGGILDDLMITKHADDKFYLVTNAGRRAEDSAWIDAQLAEWNAEHASEGQVTHKILEEFGLVALQGPASSDVLKRFVAGGFDLDTLTFGKSAFVPLKLPGGKQVECHVARGGYTGEDGFEISIPPEATVPLAEALLAEGEVKATGLAARDSLRLEAGMCLYGHDLDESVSPIEGALAWTVGKDRRATADFLGAERVLRELKEGPPRRRIGLVIEGAPAREGAKIYDEDGKTQIGQVTSGIPAPTLGKNIAMALVQNGFHKKDTKVLVDVRKKMRPATVTRMPFVPSKYFRGKQ